MSVASPSRVLLSVPGLRVGEFACAPGHPLWHQVDENMGPAPTVVFPRTRVLITQDGRPPVLTTPNHVVFYAPHQRYRRGLRDARGDVCVWIESEAAGVPPVPAGPSDPASFLAAVRLVEHLRGEGDRLLAEEASFALVRRAVGLSRRVRPGRSHVVEEAKAVLAQTFAAPPAVSSLAASLYVSPFHLMHVFRARTGFTITGYVHELRLRAAVERMCEEPEVDLTRLAHELGYCSLSHFSGRFSRAFGLPPSAVRRAQLRRIVEALRARAA